MKKITLPFLLFFSLLILGQEKYSKSVSFINDNDLYTSFYRDRYYTNGMFLNYNFMANKKGEAFDKKIYQLQVGHEMFTPYKAIVADPDLHDRPFAGHLFGKFGILKTLDENRVIRTAIQLGIVGPDALGSNLQGVIHDIYGFEDINGWDFQVQNTLSLNLEFDYLKNIHTNKTNTIDFTWVNYARLGTVYTDLTSGMLMRIGIKPLAPITNSMEYGTNLNSSFHTTSRKVETYFFFQPSLRYAVYDATMQGSLFNNNSPVTTDVLPLVFTAEAGIKFTANRFNFGYTFIYHTKKMKEAVHQFGNVYGTVGVEYLIY